MADSPIRKTLIVASVQRSGSTLLSSLLRSTGVAGRPMEMMNIHTKLFTDTRARLGVPTLSAVGYGAAALRKVTRRDLARHIRHYTHESYLDYLTRIAPEHTTPNGVFGMKIHWTQYRDNLLRRGDDAGFWRAPVTWILIRRDNDVRQAISFVKAQQTNRWHSDMAGRGEAVYNERAISDALTEIRRNYSDWNEYFADTGAEPVRLTYEALAANPQHAIDAVLDALGEPRVVVPPTSMKPVSDEMNDEWERLFRSSGQV
ncbi:MAG: Stf0 family sulfotransferase [Actinomycetota bacterium]